MYYVYFLYLYYVSVGLICPFSQFWNPHCIIYVKQLFLLIGDFVYLIDLWADEFTIFPYIFILLRTIEYFSQFFFFLFNNFTNSRLTLYF